jgi:hypothetical protein
MNQGNDAPWQLHATPVVTWKGYTPATFERNIVFVNLTGLATWPTYRGGPLIASTACAQQVRWTDSCRSDAVCPPQQRSPHLW